MEARKFLLMVVALAAMAAPWTALAHEANDPVCGMKVEIDNAQHTSDYGGQRYYFCNPSCLKAFQESPTNYVSLAKLSARVGDAAYELLVTPREPVAGETVRLVLQGTSLDDEASVEAWVYRLDAERTLGRPTLHRLHRLPEPNAFGFHARADAPGELAVSITARVDGGADHRMAFRIPVGVPKPVPAPPEPIPAPGAELTMEMQHKTMRRIGDRWLELQKAIDGKNGIGAANQLDGVAALAGNLTRFTLHHHPERKAEFDALAGEFLGMLREIRPAVVKADENARREIRRVEANGCVKCHLLFQWGAVDDLSRFPDLTRPEEARK